MHRHFKRGVGALFSALLGAAMLVPLGLAVTATAASATQDPQSIEICKTFVNPTTVAVDPTAAFNFSISKVEIEGTWSDPIDVTVNAGSCSPQISVDTGTYVIHETSGSWYSLTNVTQDGESGSYLMPPTTSSLAAGDATVTVLANQIDTVDFVNTFDPGFLKVCKNTTSGVTGAFSFGVTGPDGFGNPKAGGITETVSATVGDCSDPLEVPAGTNTVVENGANLNVTAIVVTDNGTVVGVLPPKSGSPTLDSGSSLTHGTADVLVAQSSVNTNQTDVTFTNDTVGFKVCKVYDHTESTPTTFTFTITPTAGTVDPTAGPVPAAYTQTVSVDAATGEECTQPVQYVAGTSIQVVESETLVPGTKVGSIYADGQADTVTGPIAVIPATTPETYLADPVNATIDIAIGTPITSSASSPSNESVVTYNDVDAAPSQLEICKFAGTPAPVGTNFSFTVSGYTKTTAGVTSLIVTTVPVGDCAIVGGSATPFLFPYNSSQTITELASTGNATSAISVSPLNVTQDDWGTATATKELTEGAVSLGTLGTVSTVNVLMSEGGNPGGTTTEVDFTDIDPPAAPVTGNSGSGGTTPPVTVINPGGTGTTTAANSTTAVNVSTGIGVITSTAPVVSVSTPGVSVPATVVLTAGQKKALLRSDEKSLTKIQSSITKWTNRLHHTVGRAHVAAARYLAALKSQERVLKAEIKLLK